MVSSIYETFHVIILCCKNQTPRFQIKHLEVVDLIKHSVLPRCLIFRAPRDFLHETTLGAQMRWKNEFFRQNPASAPHIKNDLRPLLITNENKKNWRISGSSWAVFVFATPCNTWRQKKSSFFHTLSTLWARGQRELRWQRIFAVNSRMQ